MARKRLIARDVLELLREKKVSDAKHYRQGAGRVPSLRRGQTILLDRLPEARGISRTSKLVIPPALPTARRLPVATPLPLVKAKALAPSKPVRPLPLPVAERLPSSQTLVRAKATPALKRAIGLEPGSNEPVYVLARKQTNEVEKALTREQYREKYGYARDITAPTVSARGQVIEAPVPTGKTGMRAGQLEVMQGPAALNHSGRLRRTGRPCKHWAAFAYLLKAGEREFLGVEFFSGFRCYYPTTTAADYYAILTAGSGSYFVHDFLIGKPYTEF